MSTEIDMIAGAQNQDSQGEVLDIKGCDISILESGQGYFNDNHSNKLPDVLGQITFAKKIFGPADCDDDRQKYFYNKVKSPYIYVKGKLFDSLGDHRSAKAAAAILRYQHKEDTPMKLKASVEGGIIERGDKDESLLKRTKLKGVALTYVPANSATLVEGLNLSKSANLEADMILIKSLAHLVQNNVPSFIEVADMMTENIIRRNIEKIRDLVKANVKLYHGTSSKPFERFSDKKIADNSMGYGHYMTDNPENAKYFGGNVLESDVNVKNPFDMDALPNKEIISKLQDHANSFKNVAPEHHEAIQNIIDSANDSPEFNWFHHVYMAPNMSSKKIDHRKAFSTALYGMGHDSTTSNDRMGRKYMLLDPDMAKLQPVKKSLTAGFGGGAPTDATGGQVLQSESIDSGRNDKYITCPSCSKEQPYMKYQVKCRSCYKAFPIDTLAGCFLNKSLKPKTQWYAKKFNDSKYYKVNDVVDSKKGFNNYHLENHNEPVHQKNIEDYVTEDELNKDKSS